MLTVAYAWDVLEQVVERYSHACADQEIRNHGERRQILQVSDHVHQDEEREQRKHVISEIHIIPVGFMGVEIDHLFYVFGNKNYVDAAAAEQVDHQEPIDNGSEK